MKNQKNMEFVHSLNINGRYLTPVSRHTLLFIKYVTSWVSQIEWWPQQDLNRRDFDTKNGSNRWSLTHPSEECLRAASFQVKRREKKSSSRYRTRFCIPSTPSPSRSRPRGRPCPCRRLWSSRSQWPPALERARQSPQHGRSSHAAARRSESGFYILKFKFKQQIWFYLWISIHN